MLAFTVSSLVLCGWTLDVEALKRIFPRLVAMNPVTALAFILLSLSLWFSSSENPGRKARVAAQLCAGIVALVGLLKLTEVLFGRAVGIDQVFFTSKLIDDLTGQPNRMASNTAI